MDKVTLLGLFAAACTTISFAPQAIKILRTKQTKDISLVMYSVMVIGVMAWLAYGIALQDTPLIAANIVTLGLTGSILLLKLQHG